MSQKPNLNRRQKAVLRKSSSGALKDSFASVARFLKRGRWLGASNRYAVNTTNRIKADVGGGTINNPHLRQYIATSALLHCTDGWGFLGRALHSHTNGDPGAALHLGYYAELRAAMCFLATRGVGIFDRQHFVVDDPLQCLVIPPRPFGTHQITWLALEHWADLARSADDLLDLISPGNISLSEWLENFQYGTTVSTHLGRRWLKNWGLDLRQLSEDRDARNQVSYRPSDVVDHNFVDPISASEFLVEFWSLFEPSASRFEIVDRHLLRITLEQIFHGRTGGSVVGSARFADDIRKMLERLGPPGPIEQWTQFLTRVTDPATPLLLRMADGRSSFSDPMHYLQVVSRAALLLRIATGACRQLREDVGFHSTTLGFWWNQIGVRRGLWSQGFQPSDCSLLWQDVEPALSEERNWANTNRAAAPSYLQWKAARAEGLSRLGECERIALWGFGF